jgi:predicted DNA-binding transcriptional regulator YafY
MPTTPPTKLQRWLDLIAYLVARRFPVTVEQLMEGIPSYAAKYETGDETDRETARRMFERDKDELRRAGIPIRSVAYSSNFEHGETVGYRIERKDFYLPYLLMLQGEDAPAPSMARSPAGEFGMTAKEANLALESLRRVAQIPSFPLRTEARSAFRKLAFDLDPDAFAEDTPVLFAEPPGAAEVLSVLEDVSRALLDRKRVTFTYHGIHRGQATTREVRPYGLLFQGGHWYVIGHDALRDAVRVFRVGRMEGVAVNGRNPNTPDFEVPASFRLDDFAHREAWELGEPEEAPVEARVRFRFPQSLWAERNGYGTVVAASDDGSSVRAFEVRQPDAFVRWVLSQDGEAEIVSPAALAEQARETLQRVIDAHGGALG